jgi:hypothetical protein
MEVRLMDKDALAVAAARLHWQGYVPMVGARHWEASSGGCTMRVFVSGHWQVLKGFPHKLVTEGAAATLEQARLDAVLAVFMLQGLMPG